ncbi:MAG: alanine--tRNA ligase [Candidatus Spechtbacterales bacterium]|nr:alanine--tRNA ligase [Candidatus Spechtbacterales bacterium]
MNSQDIRKKFLKFFEDRGHTVVPSSPLIPDDPSVLLTTAGMQQFKPYFTGDADPIRDFNSKNTASVQKSFRTSDIDEVGDKTHLTFFEMLGNFSFGGYFKEEAIKYAYDLMKEYGLEIDYVTVFGGDDITPKDEASERIWKEIGIDDIRFEGREDLFWGPTGNEGPCGPSTEVYIDGVEVWNIVFNEYYRESDGTYRKLKTPGVDTGMGLERLTVALQDKDNIFDTDLFSPIIELLPDELEEKQKRVIADHARGISFLVSDGVRPSNKEAGYVLRRLMRRVITHQYLYGEDRKDTFPLSPVFKKVVDIYGGFYDELDLEAVKDVFSEERDKFLKTLRRGIKELNNMESINAEKAFKLYESFGLPYEVTKEIAQDKAGKLNREDFEKAFDEHRAKSRAGQEAKFGGHGLILDTGELKARDKEELVKVTRLHTATHLLQASLRNTLGDDVRQAGSDITAKRLRFDFTFDRRLEDEELQEVEDWVNDKIERKLDVQFKELPYEEAIESGALYFEREKYPNTVKVYSVLDEDGKPVSKELCGGPHVANTSEMGKFKIIKQESVGAGVRRIRARLE